MHRGEGADNNGHLRAVPLPVDEREEGPPEERHAVGAGGPHVEEEEDEGAVVVLAHAVVDPGAVVVLCVRWVVGRVGLGWGVFVCVFVCLRMGATCD